MKFVLKNCAALAFIACLAGCQSGTSEKDPPHEETDGLEQAMIQDFKKMHDPALGRVPRERLEVAKQTLETLAGARMNSLTWIERGPTNIGGRTRAIIVDKADASGNTVIASSVSGGLFRTTNFLSNSVVWTPINDKLMNLAIGAMIQDPVNPSIIYAGTGEGWFNVDAVRGMGVFKSTDGGLTWNNLPSTANWEYVQDLEIDQNGNIYAALRNANTIHRGVMRSTNGGTSWTQVLGDGTSGSTITFTTGRAADLEVASNGDLYATLGIFSKTQVLKSTAALHGANTGALNAWIDITPVHTASTQRGEIAVAPSNPQRLYLLMQEASNSQVKTIYRSSDGGVVWDSLPAPAALNNGNVSQAWFNLIAAVDPNNPDVVVAGAFHVVRSTDAGANFQDITQAGVHVDQHVLIYTSSTSLILGNDGGVYHSPNANNSSPSFLIKNNGFNVTQFYGVDYHPTDANYYLAGAQDNNTQKFVSNGLNFTSPVVGGDGGFPHIDQTDGLVQIASTTGNNFYRSINFGASFSYLSGISNSRGQFINPSDFDDAGNTLYSGDNAGHYFYINNLQSGGTPASGINNLPAIGASREVSAIKVDPFSPNTILIGTNSTAAGVLPVVIRVTNANTSNPNVVTTSTLGSAALVPAGSYISSLDIDLSNPSRYLATVSNYGVNSVFESTDAGASWHTIEGNLPDMPVYWGVFAPSNAQLDGSTGPLGGILLGTELGVWTTTVVNGSATSWLPNSSGSINFPNVRTDMIKIRPTDYTVVAATHGRGLYTTQLTSVPFPTGVGTVGNTKDFIKFATVNPQQIYIKTGNMNLQKMQIRIFDMNGRLLLNRDTRYSDQSLPVGYLPSGTYILKVHGNKGEQYTWHFAK
jgi:hypothetical protein